MSARISILANHLATRFPQGDHDPSLDKWREKSSHLNQKAIHEEYLGPHFKLIDDLRQHMANSDLFNYYDDLGLTTDQVREKVMKQLASCYKAFPLTYELDSTDVNRKVNFLCTIGEYDIAVSTRITVNISLYLDSLISFGTEKHRELIDRCYKVKDIGCFCMTELGHGSNVSGVETTATFVKETREFIINSPTRTSAKWWVGAVGKTANMTIVWAQLIVEGVNQGVHMFVVPIRGQRNENIEGVVLGDCGPKMGLSGIDNGFALFNNYRVGYDALLDKLTQITPAGKFKSSVKSKDKRLGIMIGALIRGRNCVMLSSANSLQNSVICALRYSAVRKQFAPDGKQEASILSYQGQKVRLIPLLAQCFASKSANHLIQEMMSKHYRTFADNPEGEELAEFHAILSGFKAVCSWYGVAGCQVCRESCGGHGYSAFSSLGRVRDNQEVNTTWEGDNMVLIQQTSKYITKQIQKTMKGHHMYSETLRFLKLGHDDSKKPAIQSTADIISALEHVINLYLNDSLLKIQEQSTSGGSMTDIWNSTQSYFLQELAKSYTELIIFKEFNKMVDKITARDKVTGETIGKLRDIYGLSVLERYLPALVEVGYSVSHRKDFRDRIIRLCEEVGEVCIGILDAIAPPDKVLNSSIGSADGQVYSRIIQQTENWPDVYSPPYWKSLILQIRGLDN